MTNSALDERNATVDLLDAIRTGKTETAEALAADKETDVNHPQVLQAVFETKNEAVLAALLNRDDLDIGKKTLQEVKGCIYGDTAGDSTLRRMRMKLLATIVARETADERRMKHCLARAQANGR